MYQVSQGLKLRTCHSCMGAPTSWAAHGGLKITDMTLCSNVRVCINKTDHHILYSLQSSDHSLNSHKRMRSIPKNTMCSYAELVSYENIKKDTSKQELRLMMMPKGSACCYSTFNQNLLHSHPAKIPIWSSIKSQVWCILWGPQHTDTLRMSSIQSPEASMIMFWSNNTKRDPHIKILEDMAQKWWQKHEHVHISSTLP